MPAPLSGPGIGLQTPQFLYPSELFQAPPDAGTNRVCLSPGDMLPVPRGSWLITLGKYLILEFKDPVNGIWTTLPGAAWDPAPNFVDSDGFSFRIANRLACPCTASVVAYGSAYVQASTFVTQVPGTGTWLPIVGGQLGNTTVTVAGAGYGVAPIVIIPPPPGPSNNANGVGGVQASGFVTIASGTVSAFSFTNPGAGYPTAPTITILPNPTDPNIALGITTAVVTCQTVGSGSITACLCTNPGAPLATVSQISLVLSGAGSAGSVVANVLSTIATASVSGVGVATASAAVALLTTVGGVPATGTITNSPEFLGLAWLPRPAQIGLTTTTGTITTQLGTIYDGGMFLGTPTGLTIQNATGSVVSNPTLVLTLGGRPDIAVLQPLST